MAATERDRRRVRRPLRDLTDDELHALNDLFPIVSLFREQLSEPLSDVSYFANAEINERFYEEETKADD